MAPRRGGGGGSSGGGGGGGSSSFWLQTAELIGSDWTSAIYIANVVFAGILMVGLIGITIWNATIRKAAPGHKIFSNWYSFKLAMFLALFVYTFQFIHLCLSESDPEVAYIYFLIKGIIFAFEYLAQIVLLATIYCIFVYLTRSMGLANSSKSSGAWKAVHTIHFCFCGVLCCLFVALLGLSIDQIVKYVPDPYYLYYYGMSSAYNQLVAAYYILYMLASIEAVALSGYFFAKTKDLRAPKNILIVLIATITIPLMLRSVFEAAVVIDVYLEANSITTASLVAEWIFYTFGSLLAYGGIVLIGFMIEKDFRQGGQGQYDQYGAGYGAAPAAAPDKQGAHETGQPPPQYQRYVQPGTQQYPQQYAQPGYPPNMDPARAYHPSNQTSPVNANGYPAPGGQAWLYGQPAPPQPGYGQPGGGYPGLQQYGQPPPHFPQQLAGSPPPSLSQQQQQHMGEMPAGQPPSQRPGELPVGHGGGGGDGSART